MTILELPLVVIALIGSLFLSLFTYFKNPKSATNILFVLFASSLSAYIIINYISEHQSSDVLTLFWIRGVISIAEIINLLYFLLASTFPGKRIILKAKALTI